MPAFYYYKSVQQITLIIAKEKNGLWVKVKKTGFTTVFANDIRADAKAAWVSYFNQTNNNANSLYHLGSIVDFVKSAYEGVNVFPDNIDVVTGGFPCQDFSVAGKRKGFNSEKSHIGKQLEIGEPTVENRGNLYMWMREVVSIVKPSVFIAENVKGLISLEDVKSIIENDFSNAADGGYIVIPARILHSANFGIPQSRERVFFYGFKKSALNEKAKQCLLNLDDNKSFDPYPIPTHSFSVEGENLMPYVTVKEAFNGLSEPKQSNDISQQQYSHAKYLPHRQGNIEVKLDRISPTIRSEHHGNIEFRRLSKENGGTHYQELQQGLPERRLTIRECARLQTFPDNYQFIQPKTLENSSVNTFIALIFIADETSFSINFLAYSYIFLNYINLHIISNISFILH